MTGNSHLHLFRCFEYDGDGSRKSFCWDGADPKAGNRSIISAIQFCLRMIS